MRVPEELRPAPQELASPDLDIWPEHWAGLQLFLRLSTQWRWTAMGGGLGPVRSTPTGLDYGRLEFWLELDCVPRDEWRQAVGAMQAIELQLLQQRAAAAS